MKRNLFAFAVVGAVLTTNINSAAAESCDGTCFDQMQDKVCSLAIQHNRCSGASSIVCCPAGGTVSDKPASSGGGTPNFKITAEWGRKVGEDLKDGVIHVAWDRNLTEHPVSLKFKTEPSGQVVRVAEGGRDPMMLGTQVNPDVGLVLDEGNHGTLNACVAIGTQCHGFATFGPYEVKRAEAPRMNKLIAPVVKASQMDPLPRQTPTATARELQADLVGNRSQLDRIEGGVDNLQHGPATRISRTMAATGGGAAVGLGLGAALGGSVLGGMAVGGPVGAGVGLVVGLLWWAVD